MEANTLTMLQAIDLAVVSGVVQQAERSPDFKVLDWSVQPISHGKIIGTTGGLFLFSGTGQDERGSRPWSVALKVLNNPKEWAQAPRHWAYWKRELLWYQSGLLETLPPGVGTPCCYGTAEHEGGAWIWMEYIQPATGPRWSLEHFGQAARCAGLQAAGYLRGASVPDEPWLCTAFFHSAYADGDFWARHMDPDEPASAWQNPLVQRAFSPGLRAGVLRIWAEKQRWLDALDGLPRVLCHNDFHRRNLMLRAGASRPGELVAVDWAFSGAGALGSDLGELVANSTFFFESEPAEAAALEQIVLDGYAAGLHDGGWSGDLRLARLGYLAAATLFMGASLPGWTALMLGDDAAESTAQTIYGRSAEAVLAGWVTLCDFLMRRAEAARQLMIELKIG